MNTTYQRKRGKKTRSFCVYTVYDNRNDEPIIVDGDARKCAEVMGVSRNTFYSSIGRTKSGFVKKWTILRRFLNGGD